MIRPDIYFDINVICPDILFIQNVIIGAAAQIEFLSPDSQLLCFIDVFRKSYCCDCQMLYSNSKPGVDRSGI